MFLSWPLKEGELVPALGLGGPVTSGPMALPGAGTVIWWQEAQSEWVGAGGTQEPDLPLRSSCPSGLAGGDKTCGDAAGSWLSRVQKPWLLRFPPCPTVSAEGRAPDPPEGMRGGS